MLVVCWVFLGLLLLNLVVMPLPYQIAYQELKSDLRVYR
jgi:hypothetical protein